VIVPVHELHPRDLVGIVHRRNHRRAPTEVPSAPPRGVAVARKREVRESRFSAGPVFRNDARAAER
jgi:hypothetical protein